MKKTVIEIITTLKKHTEPGKKTGSFWEFMKSQLSSEGTWEQSHLAIIEKEIDSLLSKLDKKTLLEMWKETPAGDEKFDVDKKIEVKEMKADLTDELMGQVMDRMDDNYSSRDSYYTESTIYESEPKKESENELLGEDTEPEDIPEEEIDLEDDSLFNKESDEEDDDYRL